MAAVPGDPDLRQDLAACGVSIAGALVTVFTIQALQARRLVSNVVARKLMHIGTPRPPPPACPC